MKLDMSLPELLIEAEAVSRDVQSTFGQLNAEQLNWKPGAEDWSVAQCLDHLIAANKEMLLAFDPVIGGSKQTRFLERLPFWSGFWGRMMVKVVSPQGTQKFKAPATAAPTSSKLDPQIVGQFVDLQQEIGRKIKAIEQLSPDKVIITSPFAGFITYSLLDACRIIVAHERRHFEQAQRVMAAEGFPT
ncbi:MAG: DinB family protein [Acidobacteria bacterium]|nr:DinB family protein [Acidobacteriota bacterium]